MEFKITSFKKFNEAVKKILGYLEVYDELIDRLVLDKKYYRDEIEQGDYSDEDLKAIIYGNFDKYEIHLLNTVYYMFEDNNINLWKSDIDLPLYLIKNVNKIERKYVDYYAELCCPSKRANYKDRKKYGSLTFERIEIYYKTLCTFENKYKIKD